MNTFSVTGNASGSYTFNTWKAEEYLCHNLNLLAEANEEFGSNSDILSDGAEVCDVIIRCYLLSRAINKPLQATRKRQRYNLPPLPTLALVRQNKHYYKQSQIIHYDRNNYIIGLRLLYRRCLRRPELEGVYKRVTE